VANISDAALFRAIGQMGPTLLFDEVDAIYGAKARDREDLRGLLNAGYRRGAVVLRMGGKSMTALETFPVFAAKAFAGIGDCLPDTLVDRSIPIRLQRRLREEQVERFRRREAEPAAAELRDRLADWLQPQTDYLRDLRPHLPDELDDRAQDVWEPLLAIADLAGGDWPARARTAALELSAGDEREDGSLTSKLITDIHSVFEENGVDRLRTSALIDHLAMIEERPWGDWYGKPITPQKLSNLLSPYRIRTMPIWVDGEKARGYKRESFADAFSRVGGRGGRDGRYDSASHTAPTTPTAPTAYPREEAKPRRLLVVGDDGYLDLVAAAHAGGHLTTGEALQRKALHDLLERESFHEIRVAA
jgi:hypothetical protein